jgi:hypothetical protein
MLGYLEDSRNLFFKVGGMDAEIVSRRARAPRDRSATEECIEETLEKRRSERCHVAGLIHRLDSFTSSLVSP